MPTLSLAKRWYVVAGLFAIMAFLFCWPILTRLSAMGIWDWSEAAAHYEAMRHTVLRYHQFPLWNPYMCGGGPALANPQTYWFSVTGFFALLFGSVIGPKLAIMAYLIFGGMGMWFLVRKFGLSGISAFLAGIIFLMSGYMATHLSAGQFLWLTLAWVPWVFYGYVRAREGFRWLLLGAAALAMIGLEGRSYLVAYMVLTLAAVSVVESVMQGWRSKAWLRAGLLVVMAFGLGAWKFVPDLFFLADAAGKLANSYQVHLRLLPKMLLLPDVSPNAPHAFGIAGDMPWFEFGYYVGWIVLALAAGSLFLQKARRALAPWIFAAILLLSLVLSEPGTNIFEALPVLNELRNPQRAMSLVIFILALMSAFGLEGLMHLISRRWKRLAVIGGWIVVIAVAFDLLRVTSPALAEGYAAVAVREGLHEFAVVHPHFSQGEGFNDPFPVVKSNQGAAEFCPAVFRAWYDHSQVVHSGAESYRGEVFVDGPGEASFSRWTPNEMQIEVKVPQASEVVVNQNSDPGWKTSVGHLKYTAPDRRIRISVPAGNHTIRLRYLPSGFGLGTLVSVITLGLLVWGRRRGRGRAA